MTWWAANKEKYPVLALLAIPATSAPSERFFCLGALILSKLRNRISRDTFETIISLKSWGIFINKELEEKERVKKSKLDFEDNSFIL